MRENQTWKSWALCLAMAALSILAAVPGFAQSAKFTDLTATFGLDTYDASAEGHGPGAVFADLNCDGFPDLYLVRRYFPNELWWNVDTGGGQRGFQQATNASGADDAGAGQGAIAGDYDNDGDLDIFLINWRDADVLYKNQWIESEGGCTTCFVDVTASTDPNDDPDDVQNGVGMPRHIHPDSFFNSDPGPGGVPNFWDELDNSMTAAWGDVDRDGDLDLFVGTHDGQCGDYDSGGDDQLGERDTLFINQGGDKFWDATLAPPPGSSATAWDPVTGFVGYDGLDAYKTTAHMLQSGCASGATSCSGVGVDDWVPIEYNSTNAAAFTDFNNDGWLDLFVTNKAGAPVDRDILYINRGRNAQGDWLGFQNVTYTLPSVPDCFGAGIISDMGLVTGDLDNDGDVEAYSSLGGNNNIWVNEWSQTGTLHFLKNRTSLPAAFSWGVNFADFDNNGLLDAHIATQCEKKDYLYLQSAPWTFSEQGFNAGISQTPMDQHWLKTATEPGNVSSRGNPTADYDRDGWIDFFVVNRNSACAISGNGCWGEDNVSSVLFRNDSATFNPTHHYLNLHLTGGETLPGHFKSTRDAIGARVLVRADRDGDGSFAADETMLRDLLAGTGNAASTSALDLHFGLGQAGPATEPKQAFLQIQWPSGRLTEAKVLADAFLNVGEAGLSVDAHWKFEDDLLDVTARHDGTPQLTGMMGTLPKYGPGPYGRALKPNGTYGVAVPDSPFINQMIVNQRTISLWFKADQISTGNDKQVLYEEGANIRGLNIYLYQGSLYAGGWNLDAAQGQWQAWMQVTGVQAQTWHHFVLYFDANNVFQAAFLDNQVAALAPAATVFSHGGNVRIGMNGDTIFHDTPSGTTETAPSPFVGEIDDLRIYNRVLLVEEIAGIFEFGEP